MLKKHWQLLILGLSICLMVLVACQPPVAYVEVTRLVTGPEVTVIAPSPNPEIIPVTRVVTEEVIRLVTEEVVVEVTKSPLGSVARPVQLLFPATVNTAVISTRGQALIDALEMNGLEYEIGIVENEQQLIALLCLAPIDTIGFVSAMGYVWAHEQCGAQIGNVAQRSDDLTWQMGMIVVRNDSGLSSIDALAGLRWGIPDTTDLATYWYFKALFTEAGIEVEEVMLPGDASSMLAVFNREVDFATGAYVPPILPYETAVWSYETDSPEIWRRLGIAPSRSPIGYVVVLGDPDVGGYRVRDARAGVFDTQPNVFNETQILLLSEPIPNQTIVLGADFPLGLAREVIETLESFVESEACNTSLCSNDFYGWTGLEVGRDGAYDSLRFIIETLSLTEEEVLEP